MKNTNTEDTGFLSRKVIDTQMEFLREEIQEIATAAIPNKQQLGATLSMVQRAFLSRQNHIDSLTWPTMAGDSFASKP